MEKYGLQQKNKPCRTVLPVCSFCQEVPEQGIHGGVKIKNIFICRACEWKIVTTQVGSRDYTNMVQDLKELFACSWRTFI